MRKKKVLFLIESFIVGGAEKVLIDIVNHLNANEYDVTVCSVFKHSVYKHYNVTFGNAFFPHVKYRYLVNNRFQPLYVVFNFLLLRCPKWLFRLLIGHGYDKVVAFYEGLPTYWVARAGLKKQQKIAWLHTSTELSQRGMSANEITQQGENYAAFQTIVAVSEGVKESFVKVFPALKQSVQVAYNPIDMEAVVEKAAIFCPDEPHKHPLFVSVGRLNKVKGFDRWLQSLYEMKQRGYTFEAWIVGGGDEYAALQEFIRSHQMGDYVKLLGHQSNPYPYMKAADWMVCPSLIEGFPLVILESFALHKPILMTKCSGTQELLGNSEYGLVAENSLEGIVKKLEQILSDGTLQSVFAAKSAQRKVFFAMDKSLAVIQGILNA